MMRSHRQPRQMLRDMDSQELKAGDKLYFIPIDFDRGVLLLVLVMGESHLNNSIPIRINTSFIFFTQIETTVSQMSL